MAWVFLVIAIMAEVVGTLCLRAVSDGRAWQLIAVTVIAYALSFAAMAVSLKTLNVGTVYAIWSAVGTLSISIAGYVIFGDRLSLQAAVGVTVIVAGVVVLVTSGSTRHGG